MNNTLVVRLHMPLRVPLTDSGRWQLDIDHASLDQVDVQCWPRASA